MNNKPNRKDINPSDDLDGRLAEKHWLGKSVSDGALLIKEKGLFILDDFTFMGMQGFAYYFESINEYLNISGFERNDDVVAYVLRVLIFREDDIRDGNPDFKNIHAFLSLVEDNFEQIFKESVFKEEAKTDFEKAKCICTK